MDPFQKGNGMWDRFFDAVDAASERVGSIRDRFRKAADRFSAPIGKIKDGVHRAATRVGLPTSFPEIPHKGWKIAARVAGGAVVASLALPAGFWTIGQFSGEVNNARLSAKELPEGSSYIIDVTARLIQRELDSGWAPSAIGPLRVRTDVEAFQRGILDLAIILTQNIYNHLAKTGSESNANPALTTANKNINIVPDSWTMLYRESNNTTTRLAIGAAALQEYNAEMAGGKNPAVAQRIDIVATMFHNFAGSLAEMHTRLEHLVVNGDTFHGVRREFYYDLGQIEVICEIMDAAKKDLFTVLDKQSDMMPFDQSVARACQFAEGNKKPWLVMNNEPLGEFGRAHIFELAGQVSSLLNDFNTAQGALGGAPVQPVAPKWRTPPAVPAR